MICAVSMLRNLSVELCRRHSLRRLSLSLTAFEHLRDIYIAILSVRPSRSSILWKRFNIFSCLFTSPIFWFYEIKHFHEIPTGSTAGR